MPDIWFLLFFWASPGWQALDVRFVTQKACEYAVQQLGPKTSSLNQPFCIQISDPGVKEPT